MRTFRYDPAMVQPMRDELTQIGFEELLTPETVDETLSTADGSVLLVVNSACGCAAGAARPGVRLALEHPTRPTDSRPYSLAWRPTPWSAPVVTSWAIRLRHRRWGSSRTAG